MTEETTTQSEAIQDQESLAGRCLGRPNLGSELDLTHASLEKSKLSEDSGSHIVNDGKVARNTETKRILPCRKQEERND